MPARSPRTSPSLRASPTRISARTAWPGFELDADGAPVEGGCLDDGGPDAGHDVDDDLTGGRVLGDDAPGEFGKHLGRVLGALGQVAAGSLVLG